MQVKRKIKKENRNKEEYLSFSPLLSLSLPSSRSLSIAELEYVSIISLSPSLPISFYLISLFLTHTHFCADSQREESKAVELGRLNI